MVVNPQEFVYNGGIQQQVDTIKEAASEAAKKLKVKSRSTTKRNNADDTSNQERTPDKNSSKSGVPTDRVQLYA